MKKNLTSTTREVLEISDALILWFENQGVDPSLAGIVMANLIASDLVATAKTSPQLEEGFNLYGKMVAELISEKWQVYRNKKRQEGG